MATGNPSHRVAEIAGLREMTRFRSLGLSSNIGPYRCIPLTDAMSRTQNSSAPICGFREIHRLLSFARFQSLFGQ